MEGTALGVHVILIHLKEVELKRVKMFKRRKTHSSKRPFRKISGYLVSHDEEMLLGSESDHVLDALSALHLTCQEEQRLRFNHA